MAKLHVSGNLSASLPTGTSLALLVSAPEEGGPQAMAQTLSRIRVRPAKDEWGVYDPEQAGLAALYARLEKKDTKTTTAASTTKPAEPKMPAANSAIRTKR